MKVYELGSAGVGSRQESRFRLEIEDDGKAFWVHQWRNASAGAAPADTGELRVALDAAKGRPYVDRALEIAAAQPTA
jgi:hypothetical protein